MLKQGTELLQGFSITLWKAAELRAEIEQVGISDDATNGRFIALGMGANGAGGGYVIGKYEAKNEGGIGPILVSKTNQADINTLTGVVVIGTDFWAATLSGGGSSNLVKNGTGPIIIGTEYDGPLGHNPNLEYLLVLRSTTLIAQYSGIDTSTITNQGDITLDTAVDDDKGFIYDGDNDRIICVDTANNLIRRFDSTGTTIDFVPYTTNDNKLSGITSIDRRVYLVLSDSESGVGFGSLGTYDLIPTNMTLK